ncbi:L-rhamnose mutarotase [Streptomyces sp. NPDC001027]|uniref:L-rhamnose mutarotase n=1 Tax=Streptomyces sp. NPDC001027 TaxID=3154771 RepID=UPI00332A985D
MTRVAQTIRLRPEDRGLYPRPHSAVRPHVDAALRAANVRDCSILLREDTPSACFDHHGGDFTADMAAIHTAATTHDRWRLSDPRQEAWADTGTAGNWSDLTEIRHLHPSQGDAR